MGKYLKYSSLFVFAILLFGIQYFRLHHTHQHTSEHEICFVMDEGDCMACQLDFLNDPFEFSFTHFLIPTTSILILLNGFYVIHSFYFFYFHLSNKGPPVSMI